jgi:hypothetical protein
MSIFGEFEKPTRLRLETTLATVGTVVDAATPVKTADLGVIESVSAPVADLVRTVSTLRDVPEESNVSAFDVASKIETVRALPLEEKRAAAALSPDLARMIDTIDAAPSIAADLAPRLPIERPPVATLPGPIVFHPPVGFPPPVTTTPPVATQPPVATPSAQPPTPVSPPPPPPPGQPAPVTAALDVSTLGQLRTQLEAMMPVAVAGATITAESFNALRAAILVLLDGIVAAAAPSAAAAAPEPVSAAQRTPLAAGLPHLAAAIRAPEISRVHDVLSGDLTGRRLLSVLADKGLIEQ